MRKRLERHQLWIYLLAIGCGLAFGVLLPAVAPALELLLWPVLGCLLYASFAQVPLMHLPPALRDWRFMAALLLGNFLLISIIVYLLLFLLPADPVIRLGVLLVLLVPCTDWFISFTLLGRGDAGRAIAAAPVLLFVQLLALPAYLWLLPEQCVYELTVGGHMLAAFAVLILLPLMLAWLTERASVRRPHAAQLVAALGWLPVPLLAIVVFLVAASQVTVVFDVMPSLWRVLLVFVLFLLAAAMLGKVLGHVFQLDAPASRTLAFSFSTRNSFVLLPLVLALPNSWSAAVVVIVFQSLVDP